MAKAAADRYLKNVRLYNKKNSLKTIDIHSMIIIL